MKSVQNIQGLLKTIPPGIKLVVVSKTRTSAEILEIYQAGYKIFGENRVQELTDKYHRLPTDIEWHMVGHLQTNKVKYIAPFVHLVHSVDSLKLLQVINNEASKNNRIIECLLEVHIAREESKFGLDREGLKSIIQSPDLKDLNFIRITGLMGMASFTDDVQVISQEFRGLRHTFEEIAKHNYFSPGQFRELSMGMSGDYKIAIEEGITMIRIGTLIFGERIAQE